MIKIALNMLPLTRYLIRITDMLGLSLTPARDLVEEYPGCVKSFCTFDQDVQLGHGSNREAMDQKEVLISYPTFPF